MPNERSMAPGRSPARARPTARRAVHPIRRRDPRVLRLVVVYPAAAWIAAAFAARQADVAPTEDFADVALAPIGVALLLVFLGTVAAMASLGVGASRMWDDRT